MSSQKKGIYRIFRLSLGPLGWKKASILNFAKVWHYPIHQIHLVFKSVCWGFDTSSHNVEGFGMPNGEACPTFRLGIQNPVSHLINRGRREMSVERALQTVFILIFSAKSCPLIWERNMFIASLLVSCLVFWPGTALIYLSNFDKKCKYRSIQ